jgi:hypothetical protein
MTTLREAAQQALEALESGLSFPLSGRVIQNLRQAIEEHDAMTMTRYEALIMIAADNLQALRACDVFRVLSEAPARARAGLADWIAAGRPDLAAECAGCLEDL